MLRTRFDAPATFCLLADDTLFSQTERACG